jgi:nucleotide-binding universal stress UspA family protein
MDRRRRGRSVVSDGSTTPQAEGTHMVRKILIGYDGSSRGDDALALGRALADAGGDDAQTAVVTVYKALVPKSSDGEPSFRESELRRDAEETLDQARDAWPQLERSSFRAVRAGSPSAGLHKTALDGDFDVIVVGTSHRHGVGRVWPGSATEQTLLGSPRAVAVAPPGYASAAQPPARLRRVGVAYDGSVEARHALDAASEIALAADDAELVVVDVVDTSAPPFTAGYGYGSFIEDMCEVADMNLAGVTRRLAERGVKRVRTERPVGAAERELVEASRHLDMLLLGSRSHGPAMRLLLGSVSTSVVRDAACPVLVFPRSASGGDDGLAEAVGEAVPASADA